MGTGARRIGALVLALAATISFTPVYAGNASVTPPPLKERAFLFGGIDVAHGSSSTWLGFVAAPMAKLDQDGPRLRVMGGYGRYRYDTSAVPGGVNDGEYASGEIMLGWRHDFSRAIVSVYLGAHVEHQTLANPDPANRSVGTETGVKGLIEIFARPAEHWIATASASLSSVYASYNVRAAVLRELNGLYALGLEAAVLGNGRYREPRLGLAGTIQIKDHILALSAGALDNSDKGTGAYFTMSLYAPF